MHCIRRAALRATLTASRQCAPKAAAAQSIATSVLKIAASAQGSSISARCFSQTVGRSNEGFSSSQTSNEQTSSQVGNVTEHGIFVRNIAFTTTIEQLKSAFEKFGTVVGASIARDGRGMSRGYGFVYYDNADAKTTAIAEVDGSFWHGRRVNVLERTGSGPRTDRREQPNQPSETLFIGNIPYDATDAELTRIFRELPNVQDIRVAVDRTTGWPRGFAHVSFSDIPSAEAAKQKLSETELHGRVLRIDFSAGQTKNRPSAGEDSNDFNQPSKY